MVIRGWLSNTRLSRKLVHLGPVVLRGKPLSHLFQLTELLSLTHGPSFHLQSQQCSIFKSFSFHQPVASIPLTSSIQFSSVAQLCLTLCDPMDCSRPGFPVHHQLSELTQTHVHQVSDPSNHLILFHPLLLFLTSYFPIIRSSVITVPARIIQDDLLISESTRHLCHIKHHSQVPGLEYGHHVVRGRDHYSTQHSQTIFSILYLMEKRL